MTGYRLLLTTKAQSVYKCGASDRRTPAQNLKHLLKMCNVYSDVNYTKAS